jgi:hypothetical protein
VLYTARVTTLAPFRPTAETKERLVLSSDEFASGYKPDQVELFRVLLCEARLKLDAESVSAERNDERSR